MHDTDAISHTAFGSFLYHPGGCGRAHSLCPTKTALNLLHLAAFAVRIPEAVFCPSDGMFWAT